MGSNEIIVGFFFLFTALHCLHTLNIFHAQQRVFIFQIISSPRFFLYILYIEIVCCFF